MPVHKECEQCGTAYSVPPGRASSARYCSPQCRHQRMRDTGATRAASIVAVGTKACTKCGLFVPLERFYIHQSGRYAGRPLSWCKSCHNKMTAECAARRPVDLVRAQARARTLDYYYRHRKKLLEKQRAQRDTDEYRAYARRTRRKNAEHYNEVQRRARAENPQRERERRQRFHALHPEKAAEYSAAYRERHRQQWRERARARNSRLRALRSGAPGHHAPVDVIRLWHHQRGECARCGVRFGKQPHNGGFEVDHILPLSRGGSDWPHNLQLLCRSENRQKKDRTEAEYTLWLRRRSRLAEA